MPKLSSKTVLSTMSDGVQAWDIMNALRNSDPTLSQYLPLANAENVAEVGAGVNSLEITQNAFVAALINRIAKVIIHRVNLTNPLAAFKRGQMPNGYNIEEIFVDICQEHQFDPNVAEDEVFRREIPNVKVLFHEVNRKGFYKQTISQDQLRNAFTSWDGVTQLVADIINAMYNSNAVDEFKYMKLLFSNYYSKGLFTVVKVPKPDKAGANDFVQTIKGYSNRLTFPSNQYNALGVTTQTDKEDQHLFLNTDVDAMVNINVLASAFNMDKADFMGHKHMLDDFGGAPNVAGILVDSDFFMVFDQMEQMTQNWNGQGLYWNYFYHIWQVMSASRFSNAVIFVYDTDTIKTPLVSSVIVSPNIVNVPKGRKQTFSAIVHLTADGDSTVTWKVENASSSSTVISDDGVLTVGNDETSQQLKIVATSKAKNDVAGGSGTGDDGKGATQSDAVVAQQNEDGTVSGAAYVEVQ